MQSMETYYCIINVYKVIVMFVIIIIQIDNKYVNCYHEVIKVMDMIMD